MIAPSIVIDTSVWISALLGPGGPARAVVRCCLEGKACPVMGNALFLEYHAVMQRPAIQEDCRLTPAEQMALFAAYLSTCRWVEIYYLWRPNLADEGDNHLIELTMAAGAGFIVTQNVRDFRQAELIFPIMAITPEQWLREVKR